ncbi:hypothetical protein DFR58_101182 [Anaerobacterium chartisolvens]|uniref:DUF6873 domain-containing protein n=1 Tax=Anaerobacterium chartisolvens TaxID=1297424 RepID=A0A369BK36_9FIRM|nr:hypothetical protein [Anaerobacterium chartisolvens]RCX20978.1 hypothetical protein DFR58_101182 [Anaerobacterium chartisolvens]
MNFIEIPGLPRSKACLAIVDGRIEARIEEAMAKQGIALIKTEKHQGVHDAISYHPDVMLHHLGGRYMVYAPETPCSTLDRLRDFGLILIKGETALTHDYPGDSAYNVARVGGHAFHNTRYTDPVLRRELEKRGVDLIHINQGYSKCSICIVDQKSIITGDKGILKATGKKEIEVLHVEQEDNIVLTGFKYGFIGGSTGLLDTTRLAFSGNAGSLKSYAAINEFIKSRGMEIFSLCDGPVKDIGSIIPLAVSR